MSSTKSLAHRILAPATGFLLFLQAALVVTGGAVRLTGSGLGCPTWPECTPGSYVPVAHQAEEALNVWIEFANRLLTFVLVIAAVVVLVIAAVVVLAAVLRTARKDLRGLALGQVLGIFGQGVLGGITVLTDLHPLPVAGHLILSIILIAGATSLRARARYTVSPDAPTLLTKRIATLHLVTSFVVIILGTLVTGSGPHAGDAQARRFDFDIRTVAWLHADVVIFLFGLTFAFFVAAGTSSSTKKRLKIFAVIALAQGAIGYIQYFTGIPEALVAAHLLGATLVWITSWRVWLSVTTKNG